MKNRHELFNEALNEYEGPTFFRYEVRDYNFENGPGNFTYSTHNSLDDAVDEIKTSGKSQSWADTSIYGVTYGPEGYEQTKEIATLDDKNNLLFLISEDELKKSPLAYLEYLRYNATNYITGGYSENIGDEHFLYNSNVEEHIKEMEKVYNSLSKKAEWFNSDDLEDTINKMREINDTVLVEDTTDTTATKVSIDTDKVEDKGEEETLDSTLKYILDLNSLKYEETQDGIKISYSDDLDDIVVLKLNEDNTIDLNDEHFEDLKSFITYIKSNTFLQIIPNEELDILQQTFSPNEIVEPIEETEDEKKVRLINEEVEERDKLAIEKYRNFAHLNDDDLITEDTLDDKALNKCSCYLNYDIEELKEVLLNKEVK